MESNAPIWDGTHWDSLAHLADDVETDVCVIGLGGSGLTAIHELLERGADVVGIDAGAVAGGAAGRNGGLLLAGLAPFYHDAVRALGRTRARDLYRATIEEQERIARQTPACVRYTGSLRIASDDEEFADCERQLAAMVADGLPVTPHDGPHGRGLLFPTDLSFNPLARARTLAAQAIEHGALLFEATPAIDIEGDSDGAVVTTPQARVRAQAVIVAVDGKLDRVLPELRGRVRTARLQMLATAPADDVDLPMPVYVRCGYEYFQQLADGSIALGGFRDRHEAAEWTENVEPTPEVQTLLEDFLRREIGTKAPITHRWAASVGYTEGPLPIFEEVRPNVWAIGGYSGTGNLIGALAGRAAAARALGEDSELAALFEEPTSS